MQQAEAEAEAATVVDESIENAPDRSADMKDAEPDAVTDQVKHAVEDAVAGRGWAPRENVGIGARQVMYKTAAL
jgi:hypothetical protein